MKKIKLLRRFMVLLIIVLTIFNYIDRAILVPNQEYILMDLYGWTREVAKENTSQIGILHSIFKWTSAGITILYGYLNDKFPRKAILVIGAVTYGTSSILTMFVTNYSQLVLMQIITAVTIGASLPTSYSILSDLYPPGHRGRIFGLFGISTILGDILGNMMVSIIFPVDPANPTTFINWRLPFLIVGAISVVLAILIFYIVREPKRASADDHLGEVVSQEGVEYQFKIRKEDLAEVVRNRSNFWLILNFVDNITGGYMLATAIPWLYEHGASGEVAGILIIIPALAILAGTLFWGFIGDKLFEKDKAGRVKVSVQKLKNLDNHAHLNNTALQKP